MNTPRRIAVIGLGRMGGGVARNLARHPDFDVTVFDLDPDAIEACLGDGARAAASAAEAAAGAELVVTSLPMPTHVISVWTDLARVLEVGAIAMDTSTIDPGTARAAADLVGRHGHPFVSCLLGKGPTQAEEGTIPLFVGGDEAAVEALQPVFDCIGESMHPLGTVEAATAFKLVSNLVGMTNLAVLAEGFAICREAGVADDAFVAALADTGAWSYQADVRLPWMAAGQYVPGFATSLGLKDLRLAVRLAEDLGIRSAVGTAGLDQLDRAVDQGHGDDDVAAVFDVITPRTD